MARRNTRSKRNPKFKLPWWSWVLAFCTLWLISSALFQKSPTQLITDGVRYLKGEPPIYKTIDSHNAERVILSDSIKLLNLRINKLKNTTPYRKALVNTEANSLNLRSAANIASEVVVKIPDSSIVEVIYFDEETLVLNDKAGKWCKVKYADKEGWVWGNYVQLID